MCLGPKAAPTMNFESHSAFFDYLVELIPAKYYLATTDGDEHFNLKYMKKSEREEARARIKKQAQHAKRTKLNPDAPRSTLQLQKVQDEAAAAAAAGSGETSEDSSDDEAIEDSDDDMGEPEGREQQAGQHPAASRPGTLNLPASGAAPSRGQLQERLQQRLETMRKQRKAEEAAASAQEAKQWRDTALDKGRKAAAGKRKLEAAQAGQRRDKPKDAAARKPQQGEKRQRQEGGAPAQGLSFGRLDFGDDGRGPRKARKKASKTELLAAAEQRQREAAKGGDKAEKEAWGAAVARAQGEKVLDDPRLLRRSVKKDAKAKQKRSAAWQDRQNKQRQEQSVKQGKRRDNLQARVTQKKETKKAKREKKLMRAGFEGRKQGFIATPGGSAGKSK